MLGVEPTYFNSIKVQLELPSLRQKKSRMINFNSIKVQLEHLDCSDTPSSPPSFQFHKGTIRTVYLGLFGEKHFHFNSIKVQLERIATCWWVPSRVNFNSIKVQLERIKHCFGAEVYSYFNSIKVQLEHAIHSKPLCVLSFQFHKGTIRTCRLILSLRCFCISIP